jgi:hypothetical protein
MLRRGGSPSFGKLGSMFGGNIMRQDIHEVEIKSGKVQQAGQGLGGSGETQLEMEKFSIKTREAKL